MSEDTTTTEEAAPALERTLDTIDMADVAALAMAIAIWLGNQNPDALDQIGNMADVLKEQFVDGQ